MIQQTTTVPNTPGVSVIVCCYNSAKRLPETLRHLAQQQVPSDIPWEVIVVNNASTDDTVAVAKKEWQQYHLDIPFSIVDQPKPGLSYARDKGFETAQYEYCLFCDDDNWLNKDYVRIAFETMESDAMIGVLGGQGEAVLETQIHPWFESVKSVYAVGAPAKFAGEVNRVYGAGMTIRKSQYTSLIKSSFSTLLSDREGESLSSGGDTELCFALRLRGKKIWFNPELKFYHFIPTSRLEKEYVYDLNYQIGKCNAILNCYKYLAEKNKKVLRKKSIWKGELMYAFVDYLKVKFNYNLFIKNKVLYYCKIQRLKGFIEEIIILNYKHDHIYNKIRNISSINRYAQSNNFSADASI